MTRISVSLVTLGDPATMTGGYLYHRRLADMARDHDAEFDFVSFPERAFPLPALARADVLRAAGSADVVVLDSIAAAFWGRPRRFPRPVVVMAHQPPGGIDHGRLRTLVQTRLDRRAYSDVVKVLVASEALVPQMLSHRIPAEKIVVVPPGRDVAEPDPAGLDLREGRRAAILCVGNWARRKGMVELLDAFSSLPVDAATLHLVGDETIDPAYAREVRSRLRNNVRVHGPVPPSAVAAMYRDADVFVLPSYREPYGTVYGEAMAFGLPVVGWDAGNLPHLAGHSVEGLVLPPGDVAALASALWSLVHDDELRRRLGGNARERAATFPTWDETAHLFFETLRGVVRGRS